MVKQGQAERDVRLYCWFWVGHARFISMFQIITTVTIISFVSLGLLLGMYKLYEERVAEPRKLEDELRDALEGQKPDVSALEPVRKAAAAISYKFDKIVVVRNFDKVTRYHIRDLVGIEIFADDKLLARAVRDNSNKSLDDLSVGSTRVHIRLIFDDPSSPDFELTLWDPLHDVGTARAEGPRAAMATARRWFYHVEAILRQPTTPSNTYPLYADELKHFAGTLPPKAPPPEAARSVAAPNTASPVASPKPTPKPSGATSEGDVLNAPIIPDL